RNSALWVERTPAEFRFNVKAFRLLTGHQTAPASFPPDLQADLPPLRGGRKNHYYAEVPETVRQELWRRFIEAIAPLRDAGKLTAVHFQFAPWVTTSPEWLRHIEHCVQAMAGHRVALEFRNRLWLDAARVEQTLAWLRRLGAVHVVVDEPQGVDHCAQAVWETTHPALAIVRLHGRNAATWNTKGLAAASDRFNYEYPDDELQDLAERSAALAERAFEVQVLVNVNHEDQGVRAARRLQDLLARLAAPR
ncbi:MAG: DUF72 domain-containing protein, partial [Chitinophagaceae bacterium]|nr:DUF72 domain-containing protein [Rubrivivax sp.]